MRQRAPRGSQKAPDRLEAELGQESQDEERMWGPLVGDRICLPQGDMGLSPDSLGLLRRHAWPGLADHGTAACASTLAGVVRALWSTLVTDSAVGGAEAARLVSLVRHEVDA
jgi:hypothetical protein